MKTLQDVVWNPVAEDYQLEIDAFTTLIGQDPDALLVTYQTLLPIITFNMKNHSLQEAHNE